MCQLNAAGLRCQLEGSSIGIKGPTASGNDFDFTCLICSEETVKDLSVIGSVDHVCDVITVLFKRNNRHVTSCDQTSDALSWFDLMQF